LKTILHNRWIYAFSILFIIGDAYLSYKGNLILNVIPFVLIITYVAFYHFDKLFMILVFFTPLSVNIEEFVGGDIGLFLPTEPILFGMLMLIFFNQAKQNRFDKKILFHPISIAITLQLVWITITAITSELPMVSFKFLLTKLWFFIPIYFYGILFFRQDEKNIARFIWLFVSALALVVLYTLTNHAINGFDEASGHWVMFPFFKDHTSYGAILALAFPLLIGLLFSKKQSPIVRLIILFLITLFAFGIIMSYTRAAWLSLFGALVVYFLIRFKIKFKYLAFLGLIGIGFIAFNWVEIGHSLEKNNAEHATENMDERIESMANVTSDASNLERINRWTCAVNLWQERPFLGWGPGTYAMVYGPFQQSRNLTIISTTSGNRGNAHSEYLGPLAEQGLIGMLLIFLLVGFIIYYGITVYNRMPSGEARILLLVSVLGLITYFAHGFLNNYLDTDKATIPVWGLTALIVMLDLKYPKIKV
jgi:putative inorganic carbon (HCO3(-)) transporter